MEMVPWLRGYTVQMEDLYTELTVGKIENKPTGPESKVINDYKELFDQAQLSHSPRKGKGRFKKKERGKRFLVKADPGLGKTTFCKKLAWDWAKGHLTTFSITFCIRLKLVKSGQNIEDVLIQQCPSLRQQGVGPYDVRQLLDKFGERSLVILDEFDEFDSQKNESVMALIRGEVFPQCSVLVTSRPHSAADIETDFENILRIEGFTQKHMQEFCSKLLKGEEKAKAVLSFYENNFLQGSTLYASPMLLQFICVLVENDPDMDLTRRNVPRGEIYFRLVQCIYRKYCESQGTRWDRDEFVQVLIKIGKFASKTIRAKQNCFQREEIIRELGENVFELGFLVGYEDFRLVANETTDILVTFLHETMRTFLACLYGYMKECSGEIRQILNTAGSLQEFSLCTDEGFVLSKCTQDADFLHFYLCCFFCGETDATFGWVLFNMCFNEFDVRTLHLTEFQKLFSAINIRKAITRKDDLVLLFIRAGLSRCDAAEHLFLDVSDPVEWILESLRHLRDKIKLIRILNPMCAIQGIDKMRSFGKRRIIIDSFIRSDVEKILQFYSDPFDVVVIADTAYRFAEENDNAQPINVSALIRPGVCQLHIIGLSKCGHNQRLCNMSEDFQGSSTLTHLVFNYVRITQSVVTNLTRAVQEGNLPLLEHLDLEGLLHI